MNLNFNQKIAIFVAFVSYLTASGTATELVTLFGPVAAKYIIAAANLAGGLGATFLAFVTAQASIVRDVQAMPGVEKIVVNEKANATLATLATDPKQDKIEPAPAAAPAVEATARAAQG